MRIPDSAKPQVTSLRGRGIGMLVAAAFGAAWAYSAASAEPALRVWPFRIAIVAVTVVLVVAAASIILRGRRHANVEVPGHPDTPPRRAWRQFLVVLLAEILAMNLAALWLSAHGLVAYLMPTIAIIVGLHFFPLARIFRAPYLPVAAVMTLIGTGSVLAMALGMRAATANAVADIVCALALWSTAGFVWLRVRDAAGITRRHAIKPATGNLHLR